ncbi:nucleoid-associated protein [Luteolibacter sp. AS25]|uniref:nucleoid-associated protein n=1 Tax=Luteolibacter sp. AS25 TaxID=3135776 RepID=UPI00398AC991
MSVKIRFISATADALVLAKVGHPQRDEPLQTSREVFKIDEKDEESLAALFLKPFKNLTGHRFQHHSSLNQHEMNACAAAIFASEDGLLEKGCDIAKRLYSKSNHPNIKSGDLCISLIKDIELNGEMVQGLCILKSESVVPFLSISTRDGDLELHTEQGINPEKIDKGCLILNHLETKGYYVLTFDRSGSESRFWVRDFLGLVPISDSPFLTNKYANMAVAFMEKEKKETPPASDDAPPWDASNAARDAITYFEEKENFNLEEFEEEVLKTPEAKAKFAEHRSQIEEEQGHKLEDKFEISKKDVTKAKKKIRSAMKLDTGVDIKLKPGLAAQPEKVLEHGFDEERKMKFIKIYFNEDLAE